MDVIIERCNVDEKQSFNYKLSGLLLDSKSTMSGRGYEVKWDQNEATGDRRHDDCPAKCEKKHHFTEAFI